jgi:DNA-directed RNA polymerase specialized sigma24 family protein
VIKESFLQAYKKIDRDKITKPNAFFIAIKNNRSNWYYREAKQSVAMLSFTLTAF